MIIDYKAFNILACDECAKLSIFTSDNLIFGADDEPVLCEEHFKALEAGK